MNDDIIGRPPGRQSDTNPTGRFSDRVEDYVRSRPGYPDEVLDILRAETGLTPAARVADVGSGTGISSALFLRNGNPVRGVEPNPEMRAAAERLLAGFKGFQSIAGSAEATTLPDRSVDYVVAGQAFHWFDRDRARIEFTRILRPGGWVVLMWNTRRTDTPFLVAYEDLLRRYGTDYREVRHDTLGPAEVGAVFGRGYARRVLPNEQRFDLAGLKGRLLSSSYVPAAGHPDHAPMLADLEQVFARHQEADRVRFQYDTEVYFGRTT
ncbi:MAG: Methyltransferase [Gemmataceae bacterium]|nr:Methyltransferase [Gemmataceae bacterium]